MNEKERLFVEALLQNEYPFVQETFQDLKNLEKLGFKLTFFKVGVVPQNEKEEGWRLEHRISCYFVNPSFESIQVDPNIGDAAAVHIFDKNRERIETFSCKAERALFLATNHFVQQQKG